MPAHNAGVSWREDSIMTGLRGYLLVIVLLSGGALGVSTLAQAQAAAAPRAPTVPGVTRAVEHPDTTVDQAKPDAHQPETAADPPSSGPETATDAPKPSPAQKAADQARQGVRSNTPPPTKQPD